jgi:F0F1-type ATP synthase assembly protein I
MKEQFGPEFRERCKRAHERLCAMEAEKEAARRRVAEEVHVLKHVRREPHGYGRRWKMAWTLVKGVVIGLVIAWVVYKVAPVWWAVANWEWFYV